MPVSILPFDPNPDGTCRTCRGALNPETWLCVRCGTAHGERNRCPHCRSVARTLPHPTLLRRCSVCGRPRLAPGPASLATNDATAAHLRAAGQSHRVSMLLKVLSYVLLALGLPGLVLWALLVFSLSPGLWASAVFLMLPVIPLLLWLFTRNGSRASLRARDLALDGAYSQAILATLRANPVERDAEGIAQAIGLSVAHTERLLTTLNADEHMTSRVTDDGELLFGIAEPARMRIAEAAIGLPTQGRSNSSDAIVDADLEELDSVDSPLRRRT